MGRTSAGNRSCDRRIEAREIQLFWKPGTSGKADLAIGETVIRIDFTEGKLSVKTSRLHELDTELCASFNPAEGLGLQITIDQEMIDVLGQGGVICGTIETGGECARKDGSAELG